MRLVLDRFHCIIEEEGSLLNILVRFIYVDRCVFTTIDIQTCS